ncbi:G-protein coupled receptor GRL101-like [Mercenaria mercenaria]|uniref:G-protein coupled receptor GRL101-like n=1 Tax=Mercenaria mercenaria TaxID=6596 RepID=UPI00234F731C|nr:G-protein coupled receptor GRL101-like [Mercenaria mercenaria]
MTSFIVFFFVVIGVIMTKVFIGCIAEENEVVMLVHKQFLADNYATVHGFAKQLSSDKNIVRLLSYEILTPLLDFGIESTLLNITDQQIQAFSNVNRLETCQYNIMTDRFLSTLRFTTNHPRGFIFFETDGDTALVAKTLFFSKAHYRNAGLHLFRILERQISKTKMHVKFDNVTDISVTRWNMLSHVGGSFFPEFCKAASNPYCPNGYKCSWSKMCISLNQICDGQRQCPHGDDELLCDFTCPNNCTCVGFAIDCQNKDLDIDGVETLPLNTRHLDISMNKNLSLILDDSQLNMKHLVRLNVSDCNVRNISGKSFSNIYNLKVLDVSYNLLTVLRKNVFKVLIYLTSLYLHGSYDLVTIEGGAFEGLVNIQGLQLVDSKLRTISAYTFSGLILKYIDFSNNSITDIADFAFDDLSAEMINFERNEIKHLNRKIFAGVRNLKQLKTPAYKFCCIRPTYLPEHDCYPWKDEFSSCEDLMRLSALQTMLWFVGISALLGNFFSIVYRLVYDRERLKLGYGIFVTNLAGADFLMGIYLIVIAIADAVYRKRYIYMDEYWRGSGWCTFAGVLSTVSSEASVFFLCLITLDRLFVIKFPFGQIRFNSIKAHLCSVVAWIIALFIALLPVFYESYFQNQFYSKSGVCIALPLTRDRPPGWVYSVTVFVGLNFVTFILVAFGQVSIFMEVRKSSLRMKKMQSARRKDLTVARNLLLVVTTDFMCWFPIGVMGMMALNGHVISGDVYAWSAVFILPINSALNPILYTVSAILGKTKFNPSTDEQTRTELSKELGDYIKEYQSINRQLSRRGTLRKRYRCIEEIVENDIKVFPFITLKVSYELFRCIEVLHRAFLVFGTIDKDTVCIRTWNGKLTGDVLIKKDHISTTKNEDLRSDILQTGKVINALIKHSMKQKTDI